MKPTVLPIETCPKAPGRLYLVVFRASIGTEIFTAPATWVPTSDPLTFSYPWFDDEPRWVKCHNGIEFARHGHPVHERWVVGWIDIDLQDLPAKAAA